MRDDAYVRFDMDQIRDRAARIAAASHSPKGQSRRKESQ